MASVVDPAIIKALGLEATNTSISKHGSSGFASTYKIASKCNGKDKLFFMKTGEAGSEEMFAGEHESLNAIHSAVPSLCPKSYAHGALSEPAGHFLATDFLDLSSSSSKQGSGDSLASKLAKLHGTPAPKNRLRGVSRSAEKRHGTDVELKKLVEATASKVVPKLLARGHLTTLSGDPIQPVVVHGDLWSGNHGRGSIGERGTEEVVFDPACSWSHSEFEFGIMRMFGGFGGSFEKEYHNHKPKDEPVDEYDDRVALYELYHHLNHYSIFGGGYKGGATSIMKKLVRKYGEGG